MRKNKILLPAAFLFAAISSAFAQGNGIAGITEATNMVTSYFDPGTKLIGFAAEPSAELDVARRKLAAKGLWAIAANDVSVPGIGFDSDANALTIVFADGVTVESGRRSKLGCALFLWETCFARQLNSRL